MMNLERNKNHFGGSTHKTNTASTSTVSNNNFKLNTGAKQTANFGTGIISNQSQNNEKPALFNFAIKPANQNNPNFANRKFGASAPEASVNAAVNSNVVAQVNAANSTNSVNLFDFGEGAPGNGNNASSASNNSQQ